MDSIRKHLAKLKTGQHSDYDNDDDLDFWDGPMIGIAPRQVKEEVHYMDSRGSIDLSGLRFHADDYPPANLNLRFSQEQIDAGEKEESIVDIAIFQVPEHCTSTTCDLSKFGVGSLQQLDGFSYLKLCKDGRLNINHNLFTGHHVHLTIPIDGKMPNRIKQRQYSKFNMPEAKNYEVMLANCHPNGRMIRVGGQVVFDLKDETMNVTKESLTILVSVAAVVFVLFTILTVRVNMGTRADFEQAHYGLVPDDEEEVTPSDEQQQNENEDRFPDEEIQDPGENANLTMMTQAEIV